MLFNHTIVNTQKDSVIVNKLSELHCNQFSTRSRLVFNSNGPTTSICKWNTNKLKNITNKMCIKSAINKINHTIKKLITLRL